MPATSMKDVDGGALPPQLGPATTTGKPPARKAPPAARAPVVELYWSLPPDELIGRLESDRRGLTHQDARRRLLLLGGGAIGRRGHQRLALALSQFKSPIIIILLAAAILSASLGQRTDAMIILVIVFGSGLLGFWQEFGAASAVQALLARVRIKASVVRDSEESKVAAEDVVPGDVVVVRAGDIIPADCRLLEATDLHLDESSLTGETYPVEKTPGVRPESTALAGRTNCLFLGTHVVSGTGKALAVHTGTATEFGRISERIDRGRPEADFERGVRRFGYFLMELTFVLVLVIFAINVALGRPALDSLLFTTALAVGLTPQLLPAIVSVNLAHGASVMARRRVIVKRLAAIESFGSMDVLCCDKTGTLTEGVVRVRGAFDVAGGPSDRVLFHAYLNASFEAGFANPIDEAIRTHRPFDTAAYRKTGEVPYDFVRKRLSVALEENARRVLVTKGALVNVLECCTAAEGPGGVVADLASLRPEIEQRHAEFGAAGYRALGVAYRQLESDLAGKADETGMTFLGFVVLHDPPKPEVGETIRRLNGLGIALKVITGDNRLVAETVARSVGLDGTHVLSGQVLGKMSDAALARKVDDVSVFAEVEPNQKERVLLALRRAGHVVGYVGDGINDAPALHAADAGISVDSAADVAKDAADIVLLEKDLRVLVDGVKEGRIAFANTLKYVYMATSANFGNMLSMAGVSPFLPFLPLLAKQILLMNLLTDLPEMAIATDGVDPELVEKPRRWNVREIRNFMLVFGSLSSLFDVATFVVILFLLDARPEQFRTGWFLESLISATIIVLVIRTRRPFFASRPGNAMLASTALVVCVTVALPFTPVGRALGFVTVPPVFLLSVGAIVVLYVFSAELAKHVFYRCGADA